MKNINLLILTDTEENIVGLQASLAQIEYLHIICSTDPNEAFKICKKDDIVIALIDVQTPEITGLEFVSLLKTDPKTSSIVAIMITDQANNDKSLIHGVTDYLYKPLNPEITILKVKSFIKQIYIGEEIIQKEQELEDTKKALIQAHQAAENARMSKEIFLANMSHEIRTPINEIVGIVHMLKNAHLSQEHQDWINRLEMASDSLLLIINDILDISKIDSDKLKIEMEEFHLESLLMDVEKFFRAKARDKQIDFKVDVDTNLPQYVKFDPLRLQQIISNFVSNSLKFTDQGEILLSAINQGKQDSRVKIKFTVKDTGIGIKPDAVEKIFLAFEQGDDGITKKFGGTGLGLAIVKRLAKLLHGEVYAESEFGYGSQFSFVVEMEEVHRPENVKGRKDFLYNQLPKLTGLHVLIAEDNDLNSFMLSHMLRTWNCQVTMVRNGRLALEAIDKATYDVILMDTHMPVMSGFDAIKQIRASYIKHVRKIPIITISASVLDHEQEAAFKVGADEVIGKPFNPVELYNKIIKVCRLNLEES